ncbi:MAG: response regulator transcription factor [Bacteroidales bacterium]|nr:response regulator transcription factor [Bacteroidales bacterium]
MCMIRILVVDDEQDLCEILRFNLSGEGFEVTTANSAEEAMERLREEGPYALILLDVMMDRMSGTEMARLLRAQGDETPIIFLTALDAHDDQIEGFEAGGDDYITKPFAFDTVLARVRAVLKRTQPRLVQSFGALAIDADRGQVLLNGEPVGLTRREYLILSLLAQHAGNYLSREEILNRVWPNDTYVNDRSVDVHIARLRKKLGPEGGRIVNKTGFGYTLKIEN